MLELQLSLKDAQEPLVCDADAVRLGNGSIIKFHSNLLFLETSGRGSIWVGECPDPYGEANHQHLNLYREFEGGDGIKIFLVESNGEIVIDIARSCEGGSPIYLSHFEDNLCVSWRFEQVLKLSSNMNLDLDSCRSFIENGVTQSRNQIFEKLYMLWPGESVCFSKRGLQFKDAKVVIARELTLAPRARATDEFVATVADVMQPLLDRAQNPLLEYSGGLDSSSVALAVATGRRNVASYAVAIEGPAGEQQIDRRSEFIEMFKLNDYIGRFRPGPFESFILSSCSDTPLDEMYRLPCSAVIDAHPAGSFDVAFCGIGGDELGKDDNFFRLAGELPGTASSTAIVAAASRCNFFMRRGIWVKCPLISPRVVNLTRSLPKKIREKRTFMKLALARAGLSDQYIFPHYMEHMGNVFINDFLDFDFEKWFQHSYLRELGVFEIDALLLEVRFSTLRPLDTYLIFKTFNAMKLESILRRHHKSNIAQIVQ